MKQDIKIVNELLEHARGELCSRYVLGLERARDSIKRGSSAEALRQQREWAEIIRRKKLEKQNAKRNERTK